MVKAVLFDLFNTLVTEHGQSGMPKADVAERLRLDPAVFDRGWYGRDIQRYTGVYPDYPSVLRDICRDAQIDIDEAVLAQLNAERIAMKAEPLLDIDARILDMLRGLRLRGVKIGLISNATPEEVAAWGDSPLSPWFDHIVFSFQARCMKPDARIYHLACDALDVLPERSLFVGDGGHDELTGAAAAGLTPYRAAWFADWAREVACPALREPGAVIAKVGM